MSNLMWWRPVGCDDTADDLGNTMCKTDTDDHLCTQSTLYSMCMGIHEMFVHKSDNALSVLKIN